MQRALGADHSGWRDIKLALQGEYGARTTPDIEGDARSSVMYVAAPIRVDERIIGAVSAAKPVQSFGQFVDAARRKTLLVGATSVAAVLLLMVILSVWLVRPFGLIADYVAYVRSQRSLDLPRLGRRAIGALGAAYDEMRDALAGRSYVADYVQTLTHELKSPLSAIRGAAELLREPMPSVDRRRERARPWPRHSRLRGAEGVREVLFARTTPFAQKEHRPGPVVRARDRRTAPGPRRAGQRRRRRRARHAVVAAGRARPRLCPHPVELNRAEHAPVGPARAFCHGRKGIGWAVQGPVG